MVSKTSIKFRSKKKTNPAFTATIAAALKAKGWSAFAQRLSASTRKHAVINLTQIDKVATLGDTIVVPGRVLGSGDVTKRIRVCALGFSASAVAKLKKNKSEVVSLIEEIQKNPKAEGVKVLA